MTSLAATPAYLAARLTLLALRASIRPDIALDPERVFLDRAATAVSVDSAALQLAAMPKPLLCEADVRSGALDARCRPLASAEKHEQEWYRLTRRDDVERGGFMGYLEVLYGPGDHNVLAIGRGESLMIPRSVAELWKTDYEVQGVNLRGDDVGNPLVTDDADYAKARQLGARGILQFSSPEEHPIITDAFTLPLPEHATAEERARVDSFFIEMAKANRAMLADPEMSRNMLDSTDDTSSAVTPWRRWQRRAQREQGKMMKQFAGEMEKHFAGRAMPPDVAAFIAECRKRCP
jgi:hypothetical protein